MAGTIRYPYEERDQNGGYYMDWLYGQWFLCHDDWEDQYVLTGETKEATEFALTLMVNDGLGADPEWDRTDVKHALEYAIMQVRCDRCDKLFFRQQLGDDGRCADCRS